MYLINDISKHSSFNKYWSPLYYVNCHYLANRAIMMKLKDGSNRVAGVAVVAPNVNPLMGFSPHTSCPNENMGRYTQIILDHRL